MKYFLLLQFFLAAIFSAEGQTGIPVPQMTQSDAIIQNFLNTYGVPGATVAIARDGVIVYMRAFRYSDLAWMVPDGIALCQFLYYAAVYYRYLPGRNYFTVVRNVENIMGKAEILVQNMSGQTLIWQTLLNTAKQHITSPLLTTGIYFVTIFNGKDSFTEKIMMHWSVLILCSNLNEYLSNVMPMMEELSNFLHIGRLPHIYVCSLMLV